jgi:NTE family protein
MSVADCYSATGKKWQNKVAERISVAAVQVARSPRRTSRRTKMTTRALVLGGGGPIGVAWESGLVAGLDECGVPVGNADLIVGTSAGSIVGAQIASGWTPRQAYERQMAPAEPGRRPQVRIDMARLQSEFVKLYTSERPAQELRAEMGKWALGAETMSEDEWLAGFAMMGEAWPERRYMCTAIDTADGAFIAWDSASGAPLSSAVASSCAVPGIYPPVTINDRRYMDGGMRSGTNADLAKGHDRVLVVAVNVARPAGQGAIAEAMAEARRLRFEAELEELRTSGAAVEVITPGEAFAAAFGLNLMDFTKRTEAVTMGLEQGRADAERLRAFWTA